MADTVNTLAAQLEILIEREKDKDYKKSIPVQAKEMGINYQTLNKYIKGISSCPADNLAKIARYYNVSADYLLGLTDQPTPDQDVQGICAYTGLSGDSVKRLAGCKWHSPEIIEVLDDLIFDNAKRFVGAKRNYRSILDLLHFYLNFSGVTEQKAISIQGIVYTDKSTEGTVSSNSITLDGHIIENAVLAEIQRALISLKKNLNKGDGKNG